jgi:hypothetical protein
MTATTRALRWKTASANGATTGLEHVELKIAETGISAEGVAIGGEVEAAHGLRWRITVDPDWACFRSLHLTRLGGATVALRHDGYGEWSDGEGKKRKEFSGLSDCLVEGRPFGLTALVKRLGAKLKKSQTLDVVTVSVPGLEIARASVTLETIEAGRKLRLTLGDRAEEIDLDAEGLVTRWGAVELLVTPPEA